MRSRNARLIFLDFRSASPDSDDEDFSPEEEARIRRELRLIDEGIESVRDRTTAALA
jgi:hypothetical protein